MDTQLQLQSLYTAIANGDEEMYRFLLAWQHYSHGVDDVVDKDVTDAEGTIAIFFTAAAIYQSNFWHKYGDQLYLLVALITSDYADSNIPNTPHGDFLRSTGNNMLKACAFIRGGYEHLRKVSPLINQLSYTEHHTLEGVAK